MVYSFVLVQRDAHLPLDVLSVLKNIQISDSDKISHSKSTYHEDRRLECVAVLILNCAVLPILNFIQLHVDFARGLKSKQCSLEKAKE